MQNSNEMSDRAIAIYVPLLWRGEAEEVLRDVTLESERGMLVNISAGKLPGAVDLGNVGIIPPLVNAHCHLEFSQLRQPLTRPQLFSKWIGETMRTRRENQDVSASIRNGLEESSRAGVGVVAEVKTQPWDGYPHEEENPSEVILFQEVIGLTDEAVASQREQIQIFMTQAGDSRFGLSPHAPFTVRPDLLDYCVQVARKHDLPLMMHLAETQAELELLAAGSGELVEMLRQFGMWSEEMYPTGTKPLDLLKILSQAPRVLLAHCNYLDEEEIKFLGDHPHMHVVYCPRTHRYFGHSEHPWQSMRESGVNVALGTDGRGSNPDLSIWNEVLFLGDQFPDVEIQALLEMVTVNGAKSLGMETTIKIGAAANWTVLEQRKSGKGRITSLEDLIQDGIEVCSTHCRPGIMQTE